MRIADFVAPVRAGFLDAVNPRRRYTRNEGLPVKLLSERELAIECLLAIFVPPFLPERSVVGATAECQNHQ